MSIRQQVIEKLKNTQEQKTIVGPLVEKLVLLGWDLKQIVFGKKEWYVPKSPSEATKREKGNSFNGFPVDIAVFDDIENAHDPSHLLFIIECKRTSETAGVSQLEAYYVGEPHAKLGVWCNSSDKGAPAVFLYRSNDGRLLAKKRLIDELPRPNEIIAPESSTLTYKDLITPNPTILKRVIQDILDKTVANDSAVTRREDQLDQLCNLLLLKLESDREASSDQVSPVFFRPLESESKTAKAIRERYPLFTALYPGVFIHDQDKKLRLTDHTISECVDALSGLKLLDLGVSTISLAFQVLRSEALKQGEGQYFTPQAVIEAGVRLMNLEWKDLILDPACGTGGFLVESLLEMRRKYPNISESALSKWAQTHIYGIDKDAIGTKLTKAIMQIAGDGSAHCVRGDSIRTHLWAKEFPHLNDGSFSSGRFSAIITNPPFGQNLKISAKDARLSSLSIAGFTGDYRDMEIGIIYLQRCYDLLRVGGKLGIILPETYFFSPNYSFIISWLKNKFKPLIIANIPMEAFQGFCRAKTNFYIFEKIEENEDIKDSDIEFLNPLTCGIYKDGGPRFKTNESTGQRTDEIDNQLNEDVENYLKGLKPKGYCRKPVLQAYEDQVLVPTYYDPRYREQVTDFANSVGVELTTLGCLLDQELIKVRRGHGSPSNDQRTGNVPYVKVSDIRALRININPTNLVSLSIAKKYWKSDSSGLKEWDIITPNRASSNIGEFAMLLPGEENIVLTKEVFVFRATRKGEEQGWDQFYLIWALLLKPIRNQWKRIALMQTNREDCGNRYREILLPKPINKKWAYEKSDVFRKYFSSIALASDEMYKKVRCGEFDYIASVVPPDIGREE